MEGISIENLPFIEIVRYLGVIQVLSLATTCKLLHAKILSEEISHSYATANFFPSKMSIHQMFEYNRMSSEGKMGCALKANELNVVKYLTEYYYSIYYTRLVPSIVATNNLSIVKRIIKKSCERQNILIESAKQGKIEIFRYLINHAVQCRAKGDESYYSHFSLPFDRIMDRVMFIAVYNRQLEVVKYLYSIEKFDPEIILINAFDAKIIQFAVDKGAKDYNESLLTAAENEDCDGVKLLLELGADNFGEAITKCWKNRALVKLIKSYKK